MRLLDNVVVIIAAAMSANCQVAELDTTGASFHCDDKHSCPSDLTCISGLCSMLSPSADGIVCGGAVCAPGRVCCTDELVHTCQDADELCSANRQTCDGPEDCTSGNVCCEAGSTTSCIPGIGCQTLLCSDAKDCPTDEPLCCVNSTTGWRTCEKTCT